MNAFQLFKAEMGKLAEKKTVLISVVLMLLVPLTYAAILLSSKAGPRDNIDNLPVAVVNNDKGAELNGSQIQVGDDLVKELKASKTLGWEFVTSEEADRGIKDNKYYMVVEIPEDFSENVTSVLEPSPKKAQLKFRQNEGLHFMGATVTDSAIETIKAQLNTKVTETYTKTMFAQLGQVNDGFKEAADGSKQINDGSGQLKDGTGQILTSLNEKSADIAKLADGAKQLNAGTGELLNNLKGKSGDINKLAAGAQELNAGTGTLLNSLTGKSGDINKLAAGAQELNAGTGQLVQALTDQQGDIAKLINGAKTLETGANTLNAGAGEVLNGLKGAKVGSEKLYAGLTQQLIPGSQQLAAGVAEAKIGVEESINQMKELRDGLLRINQAVLEGSPIKQTLNQMITMLNQSLADEVVNAKQAKLEQLKQGAEKLRDGLDVEKGDFGKGLVSLNSGLNALVDGQTRVSEGANQLAQGAAQVSFGNQQLVGTLATNAKKLHAGATQIKDGNVQVANGWKELTVGATALHAGTTQIKDGNAQVASGWSQLTAGATKLHDGSSQISNGNQSIKEGWTQLTDGVTQVDEGLLKLKDGSSELMTGLQGGAESTEQLKVSDNNIKMFAEPVDVDSEVLNAYPYYRDSNAPYILSLALFVGVLIMSLVVSFEKPAVAPASGLALFAGKTLKLGVLAIIQAIVLSLFVLFGLGMHVENGVMLILFSIFVSLTFLMIVLFLVAAAGNIGRFIALAFILLQVQTTGTSLPIDMLPESIRTLSNFLPLTYSIDAFRNIIILGDLGSVFADMFILLIYLAVFAVLAFIVFTVKYKNHADTSDEQPQLTT